MEKSYKFAFIVIVLATYLFVFLDQRKSNVEYQDILEGKAPVTYKVGETIQGLQEAKFIGVMSNKKVVILVEGKPNYLSTLSETTIHKIQGKSIVLREKGLEVVEITVLD